MGMNALIFNVLQEIGIDPERFSLQWASAAEAPRFVKLITEFSGKIKEMGPLGESEGIEPHELKIRLDKALAAVSSRKVRMVYGNTAKSIRKEGIFTQEYISAVIEEKLPKAIKGALEAEEVPKEAKPASEKKAAKASPKKAAVKEKPEPKKPAKKTAKKKTTPAAKKKASAPKKAAAKKAAAPKKKTIAKKASSKKKK